MIQIIDVRLAKTTTFYQMEFVSSEQKFPLSNIATRLISLDAMNVIKDIDHQTDYALQLNFEDALDTIIMETALDVKVHTIL